MKLIFLGPPGAGKGTQAKIFAEATGIDHISTGEMFRRAIADQTALGVKVKAILDAGQLVPDDLTLELVKERLALCERGYILDGFPRTLPQAESFDSELFRTNDALSAVILFDIDNSELLKRLEARRVKENRTDDSHHVQLERLNVYKKLTEPLVPYYEKSGRLIRINALGTVEEVQERLRASLRDVD